MINKSVNPPGGWLFQGLGITIRGTSFDDLVKLVKSHCINNKLDIKEPYDQIVTKYFLAKFPKMEIKSESVMAPPDDSGLYKAPKVEEQKPKQVMPSGVMGWSPMIPGQQPTTPTIAAAPQTNATINITPIVPASIPMENPLPKVEAHQPVKAAEPEVKKRRGRPKKVLAS